jgi:hypothetical protein
MEEEYFDEQYNKLRTFEGQKLRYKRLMIIQRARPFVRGFEMFAASIRIDIPH